MRKGLPSRLGTAFRDEDELAAHSDLPQLIRDAIERSRCLIVVCSRQTPQSKWVNAEIAYARRVGLKDRILSVIIEGEPNEVFPPALREIRKHVDNGPDGLAREVVRAIEPLAADLRPRDDEHPRAIRKQAALKIIAACLGCRYDDLRQRDAERQAHRNRRIAAAMTALVAAMTLLTAFAITQRQEALYQSGQATQHALAALESEKTAVSEAKRAKQLSLISQALEALDKDPFRSAMVLRELPSDNQDIRVLDIAGRLLHGPACIARIEGARDEDYGDLGNHPGVPPSVSKDGRLAVATSGTTRPVMVDLEHMSVHRFPSVGVGNIGCAALSDDGEFCATGDSKGRVTLWKGSTSQRTILVDGPVRTVEWSADRSRVLIATSEAARAVDAATGGEIAVFNFATADRDGRSLAEATLADKISTTMWPMATMSRDGEIVMTLSPQSRVRLWRVKSPARSEEFKPPAGKVYHAALSRDGRRLAAGCSDGAVRVWNTSHPEVAEHVLSGHTSWVNVVAFCDEESLVLSGSEDGTCRLWDLAGQCMPRVFDGHCGPVRDVAMSPDGSRIAVAHASGVVTIWKSDSPEEAELLKGHGASARSVRFLPNGDEVISQDAENECRFWSLRPNVQPRRIEAGGFKVVRVAVSRDGASALTFSESRIQLWRRGCASPLLTLNHGSSKIVDASFGVDDHEVVALNDDGHVLSWSLPEAEVRDGSFSGVKLTGLDSRLRGGRGLVRDADGFLHVLRHDRDGATLQRIGKLQSGHGVLTADGKIALFGVEEHALRMLDTDIGETIRDIPVVDSLDVYLSYDGQWFATHRKGEDLEVWELRGEAPVARHAVPSTVCNVNTAEGQRALLFGTEDGVVSLWPFDKEDSVVELKGLSGAVTTMTASRDGRFVAAGSSTGEVCLWSLTGNRESRRVFLHKSPITSVTFSENGESVVCLDQEGQASWHGTGFPQWQDWLGGGAVEVRSIAYWPDGSQIAMSTAADRVEITRSDGQSVALDLKSYCATPTADGKGLLISDSKFVTLLDIAGESEPVVLAAPPETREVCAIATPNSKRIITRQSDGKLLLWNTSALASDYTLLWEPTDQHSVVSLNINGEVRRTDIGIWSSSGVLDGWSAGNVKMDPNGAVVGFIRRNELHLVDWTDPTRHTSLTESVRDIVAFDLGQRFVATGSDTGLLTFRERDGFRVIGFAKLGSKPITALAISPDQKWIAACVSGELRMVNCADPMKAISFVITPRGAVDVAFHPDGTEVAAASADGYVGIWHTSWPALRSLLWEMIPQRLSREDRRALIGFEPFDDGPNE